MGGGVPWEALHLFGGLDQLAHLRVGLAEGAQLAVGLQRLIDGHMQLIGDELRNGIHLRVGQPHGTAHIPHGAPCQHGTEGDDLGDVVGAVFAHDIVDDLRAALVAEIHVKVRHRNTLGIEKALEQEVIFHRVDIGDADAVGRKAPRPGAAPRPDGDAVGLGVMDEIVDDEVVFHIAHAADGGKLVFQPVPVFLRGIFAVVADKSLPAQAAEVAFVILAVGGIEKRQPGVAEFKFDITPLGDFDGIFDGLGDVPEKLGHLLAAFYIEFVGGEFQRLLIIYGMAGLDAGEQELHPAILFFKVMGVIGGNQSHADLPGQTDEVGQDALLLLDAVVLQLDIVVFGAEQVTVPQCGLPRFFVFPGLQVPRDLPGEAGGKADEALVVVL